MGDDYIIVEMPIAVFDILGFGLKMIELPPKEVYDKFIKVIEQSEEESTKIIQEMGSDVIRQVIKDLKDQPFTYKIVSDTILLHWNPEALDREPTNIEKMFLTIIFIIKCTVFFENVFAQQIMLRGALSYGEYLISESPLCFIGSVITEIFDLEKRQEWIGFCIAEPLIDFIEPIREKIESLPIFEYDVPVKYKEGLKKRGTQCIETHHVFDPMRMGLSQMDIWEEVTQELLSDPKIGVGIKKKYVNTLNFLLKIMYPRLSAEDVEKLKELIPNIEEFIEAI